MLSVYQPGGRKFYRIDFTNHKGEKQTVASGLTSKRAAEELGRKLLGDAELLRAGLPPKFPEITGPHLGLAETSGRGVMILDLLETYLADLQRRRKRGATVKNYRAILELLIRRNHWRSLVDVTARALTNHLSELFRDGKATSTTNAYRDILNTFLRWCVDQGHLTSNPIAGVKPGVVSASGPGRRRAFAPDELQRLLTDPWSRRRHDQYTVAVLTGLRGLELTKIEKRDFDLQAWVWTCRPEVDKEGQLCRLPILPDLRPALARLILVLPEPTSLVFPRRTCAHTFGRDLARSRIAPVDEEGRRVNFHCFRYTFCTMLARRRPMQEVQRFMRHADIRRTANLYTDLGLDDLASGIETLEGLLPGAKGTTAGTTSGSSGNRNAM